MIDDLGAHSVTGSREPEPLAGPAVPASIPRAGTVFLVWATKGEYSDRQEWPVSAFSTEQDAENAAVRLGQLYRHLVQLYNDQKDAREAENPDKFWWGEDLYDTTAEGREYVVLSDGGRPDLMGPYDEIGFTCCGIALFGAPTTDPQTQSRTAP